MSLELDWYAWLAIGVAAVALALVAIEKTHTWNIVLAYFGKKEKIERKGPQLPPPKGLHVFFDHPTLGRLPYLGKIEQSEGKFALLNDKRNPITSISWDSLKLMNAKPVIESGNTATLIFTVEDESRFIRMQSELSAVHMHNVQLQKQIKNLTKSYEEIEAAHAKARRKSWDSEFKGKRLYYQPQKGRGGSPPDMGGMVESGGGEEQ